MEKCIALVVTCDNCGEKMLVDRDEFHHPRCILALCDLCAPKIDENEVVDDYTPHHVVGVNKHHLWYGEYL